MPRFLEHFRFRVSDFNRTWESVSRLRNIVAVIETPLQIRKTIALSVFLIVVFREKEKCYGNVCFAITSVTSLTCVFYVYSRYSEA